MQHMAPLWEALSQYEEKQACRMHMPGHKGFLEAKGSRDITELPFSDDLYAPQGVIAQAQQLAAYACGAAHTFFLTNGSSVGVMAMLLAATQPGDTVLLPRDCHRSALHGCILAGLSPAAVMPALSPDGTVAAGITPEAAEEAFRTHPQARAILVTRPNYYGLCCDLEGIVRVAHAHGAYVLVDEAHGAHLPYAPDLLPAHAGACGADAWVQSAHKTLPAWGQSAYLHVNDQTLEQNAARALQLLQTSSPSYLLMGQLDEARRFMATRGHDRLQDLLIMCDEVRREVEGLCGLRCGRSQWNGTPGIAAYDDTRLVFDVRSWGGSKRVYDALAARGVQCEMQDGARIVCIPTVMDTPETMSALVDALHAVAPETKRPYSMPAVPLCWGEPAVDPRRAFFAERMWLRLEDCVGRIAAGCAGMYPPGIALVWPGERLDARVVEAFKQMPASMRFGVENGGLMVLQKQS